MRARHPQDCRPLPSLVPWFAPPALVLLLLPLVGMAGEAPASAPAAEPRLQQQQEAAVLLARGRQLLAQGEYGAALDALRQAARLDPTDATIGRLLAQAEAAVRAGTPSDLESVKDQYATKARSIARQAELTLFDAEKALEAKDYERAVQHAERTLAIVRCIENVQRGTELKTRAEKVLHTASKARDRDVQAQRQRDLEQARTDALAEQQKAGTLQAPAVRALREKARRLYLDGEYDDALAAAREALRLAPADDEARSIEEQSLKAAQDRGSLAGRSPLRGERADELMTALDREATPPTGNHILLPGKTKPQEPRTVRRDPMPAWERELRAKLADEVAIEFKETPLEDCVKQLAALGKVSIVLDPTAAKETPISIGRSRMPLDALLRWVARFGNLHYCLRDGAVLLTTGRGLLDEPLRRDYDVSSLVVPEDDAVPTAVIDARVGMPGPVEPVQPLPLPRRPVKADPEQIGEGWASFVRETVAPGTWDLRPDTLQEPATPRYTIQYRNGRIVVLHTPEVHQQIEDLLNNFRRARNIQVHILGRFLQVEQTFLERLTLAEAGFTGPEGSGPGRDPLGGKRYAFTPVGLRNDTDIMREIIDPLNPTAPPVLLPLARFDSLTPSGGLGLSWNYIGVRGHTASALINAIVKKQRGTLLQAPRLTCFNTQRANIQVLLNRNYVRRISSDEEPEIGNVPEGIIFDVQPFVSADRRYITVVLQPQQRELIAMTTFSFSTGLEDQGDDTLFPSVVGRTVQVPTTRLRSLGTTVTIPNGGTLICGGFSEVEERVGTAGIPFIESIPLLRHVLRGFDDAEGRRSLLLLISAETVEDVFTEED